MQSKLSHDAHCRPCATLTYSAVACWREEADEAAPTRTDVMLVVRAYWFSGHGRMQRVPARVAPGVQSASENGVFGVGSTHWRLEPPEHFWHALWHARHTPRQAEYWPSGHALTQRLASRMASTVGGHAERLHACAVHAVHSELRGPEQRRHDEWHGWQTRSSSA